MSVKKKTNIIFVISVILTAVFICAFYFIRANLFNFDTKLYQENNALVIIFHLVFLLSIAAIVISKTTLKNNDDKITDGNIKAIYHSGSVIFTIITALLGIVTLAWCIFYYTENKDALSTLQYFYLPCGLLSGIHFIFLIFPSLQRFSVFFVSFPPVWLSLGLVIEFINVVNKAYTKSYLVELVAIIFAATYLISEARLSLFNAKYANLSNCFAYSLAAGVALMTWSVPSLIFSINHSLSSVSTTLFYVLEAIFGIYCFARSFRISESEL